MTHTIGSWTQHGWLTVSLLFLLIISHSNSCVAFPSESKDKISINVQEKMEEVMNRAKEARERFKAVRDQAVTSFRDRRDLETGQDLQSVYGPLLPPVLIPPAYPKHGSCLSKLVKGESTLEIHAATMGSEEQSKLISGQHVVCESGHWVSNAWGTTRQMTCFNTEGSEMPCEEFCSNGYSPLMGIPAVVPAYEDLQECFDKHEEHVECKSVSLYAQFIGPACTPTAAAGHIQIVAGFSAACCQSKGVSDTLHSEGECFKSSQCPEERPICLKSKTWKLKGDCVECITSESCPEGEFCDGTNTCVAKPNPHISPVQNKPLERKIFWDDVPSASFQQVECCLEGGTCVDTGTIDCINGQCSGIVDFESIITGDESFVPNMASYASNGYECIVKFTAPAGTDVMESSPATIACGVDGVGDFAATSDGVMQISGDPETDGWFKVGISNQLGVYARKSNAATFEVYTTSFVLTQDIVDSSGGFNKGNTLASLTEGSFKVGDLLVGVGLKWVGEQTGITNGNMFPKIDPNGQGVWRPSTSTVVENGAASGNPDNCPADLGNGKIGSALVSSIGSDEAFRTFEVSCGPLQPFGNDFQNQDAAFQAELPMRAFGITEDPSSTNLPLSFQILFNGNAMQQINDLNIAEFVSGWKFVLGAGNNNQQNEFIDAVGLSQPMACPQA